MSQVACAAGLAKRRPLGLMACANPPTARVRTWQAVRPSRRILQLETVVSLQGQLSSRSQS